MSVNLTSEERKYAEKYVKFCQKRSKSWRRWRYLNLALIIISIGTCIWVSSFINNSFSKDPFDLPIGIKQCDPYLIQDMVNYKIGFNTLLITNLVGICFVFAGSIWGLAYLIFNFNRNHLDSIIAKILHEKLEEEKENNNELA